MTKGLAVFLLSLALIANSNASTITFESDIWCPYVCDAGSVNPGYVVEIAEKAFSAVGMSSQLNLIPFRRALDDGLHNKTDIVLAVTKEHLLEYHLTPSDTIIGFYGNDFYVRQDNPWQYNEPSNLDELAVAAIKGYSYGATLDGTLSQNPNLYLATGDNPLKTNLQLLMKNRVQVVLENRHVIDYLATELNVSDQIRYAGTEGDVLPLYLGFSAIATQKGLKETFEKGLAVIIQNGEYDRILNKYNIALEK